MKELVAIQTELRANKDLYNNFGSYGYRSAESILEALKPLLKKYECSVLLSDEVKEVGQPYTYDTQDQKKGTAQHYVGTRVYIESTATITNKDGDEKKAKGWARENVEKAGMDVAQITGAASSYARKYALCGLFAIDDNRDADATNTGAKQIPEAKLKSEFTTAKKKLDGCKTKQEVVDLNAKYEDLWGYQPYVQYRDMKYNSLPQ